MTACLMVGATMLALTSPNFTLRWTHSVEKIEWRESYHITAKTLTLTRAAIKGSGAGMEPADTAKLENGWWVWHPMTQLPALTLAASGATGAGWQLCTPDCQTLGQSPGQPITLKPCP
ncbi:protein of unknown function [Pseudorhodobacter antarcticus]|jgi:hypothetical protein|uniref:DUF1850 domain-containing protein n=1 Tax=Pseudorhodobacter antarcticus TaxID=1077947 RepID=A0A1H8AYA7_9RHOB|nr:DUF1850 domain-containing protein [Pseudorhodobacter antarcticus]SEM74758.1 protein of unknown function [Pseudorhodobacter antarcticus]